MSKYAVWDAAKETADIYEHNIDYKTKKPTTTLLQKGVKAAVIVHTSCDNVYRVEVISPGGWKELLAKAKDTYALHCQEQTIEAEQPVVWHAVDAPVEV